MLQHAALFLSLKAPFTTSTIFFILHTLNCVNCFQIALCYFVRALSDVLLGLSALYNFTLAIIKLSSNSL